MSVAGVSTGLYGWTERFKRDGVEWDWTSLVAACAESGVDAIETDPTPERLAVLRDVGLSVSAAYVGLPLTLPFDDLDIPRTVLPVAERLAAAGGRDLLVNADPVDWKTPARKSGDDARRQGENLSRIADAVGPLGLPVALHNHAADSHNAQQDLESVVLHADDAVGLCVDTGWAHVAGHDPVKWLRDHPTRIRAVHLRNQRGRVPTEDLLDGDLDFAEIVAALDGFDGWLTMELWHPEPMRPTTSMIAAHRRSAEFLRRLVADR